MRATLGIEAKTSSNALPIFTPVRRGLLQCKCACGGTPGPTGECEGCRKKRQTVQRSALTFQHDQPSTADPESQETAVSTAFPGHSFADVRVLSQGTGRDPDAFAKREREAEYSRWESGNPIQRAANGLSTGRLPYTGDVPEITGSAGSAMPSLVRDQAERAFQSSFDDVRFHTDAIAQHAASRLSARAFTVDNHIYFGANWYDHGSATGQHLIGHELAHVLQQRRGLSAIDLETSANRYEQEAEQAGRAFAHGERARVVSPGGTHKSIQRSADPGADAEQFAVADSPYGLPFLGEANTAEELVELMAGLAEPGFNLGLVAEKFAFGGSVPQSSPNVPLASQTSSPGGTVQTSPLGKPLQLSTVAGCNVPGVPPNVIGIAAHIQIQRTCSLTAPGCIGEFPIPGDGRADLMRQLIPMVPEIGEIKPASWLGRGMEPVAETQLLYYLNAYYAAFGPPLPAPMSSFTYPGGPFVLNPSQRLSTWGPSAGIYYYRCSGGSRRRVRVPVRVPVPVPVPVPIPFTVPTPVPVSPVPVSPGPVPTPGTRVDPRQVVAGAAAVGAGIGIGYLIYRGVRFIPSLFPPLWPTIPANLAIP